MLSMKHFPVGVSTLSVTIQYRIGHLSAYEKRVCWQMIGHLFFKFSLEHRIHFRFFSESRTSPSLGRLLSSLFIIEKSMLPIILTVISETFLPLTWLCSFHTFLAKVEGFLGWKNTPHVGRQVSTEFFFDTVRFLQNLYTGPPPASGCLHWNISQDISPNIFFIQS